MIYKPNGVFSQIGTLDVFSIVIDFLEAIRDIHVADFLRFAFLDSENLVLFAFEVQDLLRGQLKPRRPVSHPTTNRM